MQDSIQFSQVEIVGFGEYMLACFNKIHVNSHPVMLVSDMCNIFLRKTLCSDSSTGVNSSHTPGVMQCKKYHSCWREFCMPD